MLPTKNRSLLFKKKTKMFKEGDGNANFFHNVANRRRKINQICELEVDVFKEFHNGERWL